MKRKLEISEPKRLNKIRIVRFISSQGMTSKSEISAQLNLSMPTTLQNVKELTEAGIVTEEGAYESTGGRKAKALSVVRDAAYACGVDLTRQHMTLALVNARKELVAWDRLKEPFYNEPEYFELLETRIREFLNREKIGWEKLSGIGFSVPGLVDKRRKVLKRSDVLKVYDVSFQELGNRLGCRFDIENDANSAAYAQFHRLESDAVYLSLSNTVGGAIYFGGALYEGEYGKSAEFGHMVIEKDGRQCYCGKRGCADAYCNAEILQRACGGSVADFFSLLKQGDTACKAAWDEYLEYLAVAVANLRVVFDCDIYLGGYVGGYLEEYLPELSKRVQSYSRMDLDASFLKIGRGKLEASAYGVALRFIDQFFDSII